MTTRRQFIESMPKNLHSLEIGALCNPILHPSSHNNKILDVFDKETLVKNYSSDPNVDVSRIVHVDYVWRSGMPRMAYDALIPTERFDLVISSHNIEHQPDLIGHLNNVSSVLKENGKMYMFIPDYRYCFDHFKSPTRIHEVLAAHLTGQTQPSVSSVMEHFILSGHNDPSAHWAGRHSMSKEYDVDHLVSTYKTWQKRIDDCGGCGDLPYIDTHVWKFCPEVFRKMIQTLLGMQLIDLAVESCTETMPNVFEFYVVLKKTSTRA